jgi:hypothetical protein
MKQQTGTSKRDNAHRQHEQNRRHLHRVAHGEKPSVSAGEKALIMLRLGDRVAGEASATRLKRCKSQCGNSVSERPTAMMHMISKYRNADTFIVYDTAKTPFRFFLCSTVGPVSCGRFENGATF